MRAVPAMSFRLCLLVFGLSCAAGLFGCASAPAKLSPVENPPLALGPDVYEVDAVQVKPAPVLCPPPEYPEELLKAKLEGHATVDFIVGPTGSVVAVSVTRASDARFAAAAREAVFGWQFLPAYANGKAVQCHLQTPVQFRME
jgi:TonB family protein